MIVGLMLMTNGSHAAPFSVRSYPDYFDKVADPLNAETPTPPEQKTPRSIGYECSHAAIAYGEVALRHYIDISPEERFLNISTRQISYGFLRRKLYNKPILRENFIVTFSQSKDKIYKILAIVDSTDEECGINSAFYNINAEITGKSYTYDPHKDKAPPE